MMLVRNVRCIADEECKYGSWLEQWRLFARDKTNFCSRANCKKTAVNGALVQKLEACSHEWFIVPLCEHHFKPSAMALLDLDVEELVPVKVPAQAPPIEMTY